MPGHGRAQRHARQLQRRRPLWPSRAQAVEARREDGGSRARICLTSAANPPAPAHRGFPPTSRSPRVMPVIQPIRSCRRCRFRSTRPSPDVAQAALDAGATCSTTSPPAGTTRPSVTLAARRGVPIVLMHMQGTPATMQVEPPTGCVSARWCEFLTQRGHGAAIAAGVDRRHILLDPGHRVRQETVEHNLELLAHLPDPGGSGHPAADRHQPQGFIGRDYWPARSPRRPTAGHRRHASRGRSPTERRWCVSMMWNRWLRW